MNPDAMDKAIRDSKLQDDYYDRYGYVIPVSKDQPALFPLDNDTLIQYTKRLGIQIRNLEEIQSAHINWHTHKSAGACWICDMNNAMKIIYNSLWQIAEISPKMYTFALDPETNKVRLSLTK